jgi:MobA-like NTP transferase domain
MKTLILPVAGRSSRFPGMRPKWLLTMPDGKLMLEKAVEQLDMSDYDRVVVVCLREHLDAYLTNESFDKVLTGIGHSKVDVCVLEQPTSSQSETVALAIEQAQVEGAFFVKDCDNMFNFRWNGGNEIAVLDLNSVGLIDAKNKSYINVDALGNVTNIVEKQVISNFFCCGGYGFKSSEVFLKHFHSIKSNQEVYLSHVIYSMLMGEESFRMSQANSYIDWGTLREYRHYTRSFITIFCDVDGVLLYNGSKFGKTGWCTEPIAENLHTIARLQNSGLLYLVITSSRPESEVDYLCTRLGEFNVRPDRFVMGLPHTRRILVNDYSSTNPFPTAMSVNLERDSKLLSSILDSISN